MGETEREHYVNRALSIEWTTHVACVCCSDVVRYDAVEIREAQERGSLKTVEDSKNFAVGKLRSRGVITIVEKHHQTEIHGLVIELYFEDPVFVSSWGSILLEELPREKEERLREESIPKTAGIARIRALRAMRR